jgi:predicted ATP-binding protein involved in virulence
MCLLNPQLKDRVAQETTGVVLIDELDIHLHPKWQRLIVRGLTAAFPRVQFITASHSPQILSELHPGEIILLQPEGFERPQVSYGLDSSRVLEQIMDAKPRPAEVDQALSELFKTIERNELLNARERLTALKELAPGIPELAGAEALIKRKEVLGR